MATPNGSFEYQAPDQTVSVTAPRNPEAAPAGDGGDVERAEIRRAGDGFEVLIVRRGPRGETTETAAAEDRAALDDILDTAFGIGPEEERAAHGTDQSAIPMAGENQL